MIIEQVPIVSVIIPAYNAEKYIIEAIESVLVQTLPVSQIEIIVIDDGSKDNTVTLLKEYVDADRIIYLQHEHGMNKGVSKTRQLGIQQAKGKYVSFLDADDFFLPEKLERQLAVMEENPDVVLIHSKSKLLNTIEQSFLNEFQLDDKDVIYNLNQHDSWLKYSPICNSSVFVRKELLLTVFVAMPQAYQHEDWLLWTLLSGHGKFYYYNEPLVVYRMHAESATASLLKNNLLIYYSRIEYLLSLYLSESKLNMEDQITVELKENIYSLARIYASDLKDSEKKLNNLYAALFNINQDTVAYIQSLKNENTKLKNGSFIQRTKRKFLNVFKR